MVMFIMTGPATYFSVHFKEITLSYYIRNTQLPSITL